MADYHKNLKSLQEGKTEYKYDDPAIDILETFPSPISSSNQSEIVIEAPEFTSLCPVTGQPDFARIVIVYTPDKLCVESKSLKLYLGAFRMHRAFHEECVNRIADDLIKVLMPAKIRVEGQFTPRGGIKLWPSVSWVKMESV